MSRQTGDMEATSTVRTQASDTVDIIRETPDRSASYTNELKRRMRWVDIDAAMSHHRSIGVIERCGRTRVVQR